MHEIKKKYLLLSSVNTSVPYPGKSVYFLITINIIVIMSAFPPSNTFSCRLRSLIIPLKDYKEIYY